jgi:hypothetical protein
MSFILLFTQFLSKTKQNKAKNKFSNDDYFKFFKEKFKNTLGGFTDLSLPANYFFTAFGLKKTM